MESVKEFFQSIVESYQDRIKSPLIGSFVISFVLFNWRSFVILLFSDWAVHVRIKWIEDHYFQESNFWWPVAIAIFYILLLPYINLFFDWLLSMYTSKKTLRINFRRNADLIRRKGEAVLLKEIADAEAGTTEMSSLKERNESLQTENSNLINQNQEDLERHNKVLDQFKIRENEYRIKLQELTVQTDILLGKRKFTESSDITLKDMHEVISLAETFDEVDKKNFSNLVYSIYNGKDVSDIKNAQKHESLGLLLIPKDSNGRNQYVVTKLGSLLYDYLKNGVNLDLASNAT